MVATSASAWTPRTSREGAWSAQVQYRPPGSHSWVIRAFPGAGVREDTTRPLTRGGVK